MSVQPLLLTQTDNRVVGNGLMYQLDNDRNELTIIRIHSQRACFKEDTDPEDWPTTFIEQKNLHKVSRHCRGVAVAVHSSSVADSASLGVVISMDSVSGLLHYYKWIGPTHVEVRASGHVKFTPKFCFVTKRKGWTDRNGYGDHFSFVQLDTNTSEIHFLNQVSGRRVEGKPITKGLINEFDGCFQCSDQRPDFLLPFRPSMGNIFPEPLSSNKCNLYRTDPSPAPQKKTRGGRNRKRRKSFASFAYPGNSSFDEVASDVIYVANNSTIKKGIAIPAHGDNARLQLFAVPYVANPGRFGLLTRDSVIFLFKSSGQSIPEHDKAVENLQVHVIDVRCIDLRQTNRRLRFCLLEPQIYQEVKEKEENLESKLLGSRGRSPVSSSSLFHGTKRTGGNEYLPGTGFSQWFTWPFEAAVNVKAADVLSSTYGPGYGSRACTESIGQNFYQGTRQSSRPHPNPTRGPGQANATQYSREHDRQCSQPACERFINSLAHSANNFAEMLDRVVYRYLMEFTNIHNVVGVCRRKIITQGIPGKCFAFANACHVDKFDAAQKDVEAQARVWLEQYADTTHRRNKLCYGYLEKWITVLGHIGRPTTCGYVWVGNFEDTPHTRKEFEVIQYFVMDGLGIAVRIPSNISHMFYGSAFSHQTAVTLVVVEGKVLYHSKGSFRVFAWGAN